MATTERVINITLNEDEGEAFVCIAQCLSLLNRKLVRQGSAFMIEEIRLNSYAEANQTVSIRRLASNWVLTNAHTKALAEWNEQQIRAAKEAGSESFKAKWRDFKIYMSKTHWDAMATPGTFDGNHLPDTYTLAEIGGITGAEYEWGPSNFVVPNVTVGGTTSTREYQMIATGADGATVADTYKSMVLAYAESRARPMVPDPNIVVGPDGGLYTDMENVGEDEDEIIANWVYEGNEPPYPIGNGSADEGYPGGEHMGNATAGGHLEAEAVVSSNMRSLIPGFVAPCGLLRIGRTDTTGVLNVQIRIAAAANGEPLSIPMKELN